MSINSTRPVSSSQSVQSQETLDNLQTRKGKSTTASSDSEQTQVSLSAAQSQLTQSTADDIDLDKVESLKQAIKNGELQIDVGKIADNLLALSSDLSDE